MQRDRLILTWGAAHRQYSKDGWRASPAVVPRVGLSDCRPSVEDHLGTVETPRPIVLLDHGRYKTKLVHYEDFYYFIREDRITRLGQRSITYASKRRAMQVFEMDKIRWWRE